jgi:hypothetical protein
MRKGSVSIVPLMIAIFMMFWFIMFLGTENDQLHKVNKVENLQRLQERLLYASLKRKYELQKASPEKTEAEIDEQVNLYIEQIMKINNIDDK